MPPSCGYVSCSAATSGRWATVPGRLGQLDRGGLWSLPTLCYADKHALALVQACDACPLKRGGVHEDIPPAAIPDNEAEPFHGVVPLHRPHLLSARLQGPLVRWRSKTRSRMPVRCCSAAVHAYDFGHLGATLPQSHSHLERLPRLQSAEPDTSERG